MELELQFSDLEKENAGVQKNLKDCHALLVTAKIDPGEYVSPFSQCVFVRLIFVSCFLIESNIRSIWLVLGERVGDAARQNEDQRREVMVHIFYYTIMFFFCHNASSNFKSKLIWIKLTQTHMHWLICSMSHINTIKENWEKIL